MTQASTAEVPEVPATPEPGERTLHNKVLRGSAWTLAGYGAGQLIRAGSNLIMVRLLDASAFGLMNLVNVFLQGLQMFSDIGIRPSIIQSKRGDDPAFLNTAWTISVVRGFLLWIVATAAAWPVSIFFHEKALLLLIPVTAVSALIAGFQSTSLATANRHIALGRMTIVELTAQGLSVAIVILWAWLLSPTAWAFVAGGVGNAIIYLLLSHLWLPGIRHRFQWDKEAAHSLMKFGRWVFLSTAITFLAVQIDPIVLGRLTAQAAVGVAAVGIYANGRMWGQLPAQVFQQIVGRVFFPAISKMIHAGTFDPEQINRLRTRLLLPVALGSAAMFVVAVPAIQLVYPQKFWGSGDILGIIALGSWIGTICHTYGNVLLAAGKPKYISFATASKLVLFLVMAGPAYYRWDIQGIAIAYSASEMGSLIPMLIGARTIGVAIPGREFLLTLIGGAYGVALYGLQRGIFHLTGPGRLGITIDVVTLGVITGALCLLCVRSLLKYLRGIA